MKQKLSIFESFFSDKKSLLLYSKSAKISEFILNHALAKYWRENEVIDK